jgi:hypothetical protein
MRLVHYRAVSDTGSFKPWVRAANPSIVDRQVPVSETTAGSLTAAVGSGARLGRGVGGTVAVGARLRVGTGVRVTGGVAAHPRLLLRMNPSRKILKNEYNGVIFILSSLMEM